MGRRTLSLTKFLQYAHDQILEATVAASQHFRDGTGLCVCSREMPCGERQTLRDRVHHFETKIWQAENGIHAAPPPALEPAAGRRAAFGFLSPLVRGTTAL